MMKRHDDHRAVSGAGNEMHDFANGNELLVLADAVETAAAFYGLVDHLVVAFPVGRELWTNDQVTELVAVMADAGRLTLGTDVGAAWPQLSRRLLLTLWRCRDPPS